MESLNIILLICINPCFGQWFHPQSGGGNSVVGPASSLSSPPALYPIPSPNGFPAPNGRVIAGSGGAGHQNFPQNFQFDPTTITADEFGAGGAGGLYPTADYHKPFQNHRYMYATSPAGVSPQPSNSKSISGDYCLEPILSCDTTNTVLYCIQGRCTCPTQWTLSPGNLPLNSVWHPELKRCVSLTGSGCHLIPPSYRMRSPSSPYYKSAPSFSAVGGVDSSSSSQSKEIASSIIKGLIGMPSGGNGYVYCQPGTECRRHASNQEVGICGAAPIQAVQSFLVIGAFSFYYWIWAC